MVKKNNCKSSGFTIIEVMIVLFIMGLFLAIVVPQFQQSRSGINRDQFIENVRALVSLAWQQALVSQKIHKVVFNLVDRGAHIERAGAEGFAKIKPLLVPTTFTWPKEIEIKQFIIDGSDQLSRFGFGQKVVNVYFYIMPDGSAQQVIIKAIDKSERRQRPQPITISVNPVTAQIEVAYA